MEHYVTLFDSLFLPQGLALHASLQRHAGAHRLWILCMDDATHEVLEKLALPNVALIRLSRVETPELLAVKPTRSRGEYCWTLTPFAPRFVFDADPSVQQVTYIDADMWLTRSPALVFDEFAASGKAVLITEHAYAPDYDQTHWSGRFCVQFMTFVRGRSELVRAWWADRCIEWCYSRQEDGKFGDQKYLDDWPHRFAPHVHVLQQRAALQAPWNASRFAPSESVAFHFHALRTMPKGRVVATDGFYRIPGTTLSLVYKPYVAELRDASARLLAIGVSPQPQLRENMASVWVRCVWARRHALKQSLLPKVFI